MIYKSNYEGCGKVDLVDTGHDYDFIAYIENKTDKEMHLFIDDLDGLYIEPIVIKPGNWIGFLADDEGRGQVESIKNGDFKVEYK